MTEAGGPVEIAPAPRLPGRHWLSRTLRAPATALLFIVASGCVASPAPQLAPQPAPAHPLSEEDVQIITDVLDLADRRDFDFPTFSDAASAAEARVRRQAAYAAGRTGSHDARPIARHLLGDGDSTVAAAAAFALGLLADTASVPNLSERLLVRGEGSSTSVATESATALGKIGTAEALEVLRAFLAGIDSVEAVSSPDVVKAALLAASQAGIDGTEIYARWADFPAPEIRRGAVYALSRRPVAAAVAPLRARLGDVDGEVRALASRGLQRPSSDAVAGAPDDVIRELLALRHDSVYGVRIEGIRSLATFGPGPALDAVMDAARTGSVHERAAAIDALGRAGEKASSASDILRQIALDSSAHSFHRELAAAALAAVAPSSAQTTLTVLLGDPSWRVRAAAGGALASLPTLVYAAILPAATDADPRVASATVQALAQREDTASLRSVRSLLIDALQGSDVQLRAAALEAAAKIAQPALFPLFLDAFDRAQADSIPDAQLATIDAIAALGEHGVPFPERAFFARFSASPDYRVRQRVEEQFGREVRNAWQPPFPLATGTPRHEIEAAVREWIASADPQAARPRILIETARGALSLELLPEEAPLTVRNFLELVRIGFFDGQEWPRVVPHFVVQGGDLRGDTGGSPGYAIRDEANRLRYDAGTLGMALAGPDTGGSQFFLAHSLQPHLDGTYTAFGRLLSGGPVLEELMVGDRIVRVVEIP